MSEYLQVDDFAGDFQEVRNAVIEDNFSTRRGPDGADYTGISARQAPPQWFERISKVRGRKIEPKISCFRLNLTGELPHSWVHSDGICSKFATVLYMNTEEQCYGGTAFWRHRVLGIDSLPSGETAEFYRSMDRDWKTLALWEQVDFVKMKPNRFITYSTSLFHSRFPFEGFGSGPRDGRLIWICFYN